METPNKIMADSAGKILTGHDGIAMTDHHYPYGAQDYEITALWTRTAEVLHAGSFVSIPSVGAWTPVTATGAHCEAYGAELADIPPAVYSSSTIDIVGKFAGDTSISGASDIWERAKQVAYNISAYLIDSYSYNTAVFPTFSVWMSFSGDKPVGRDWNDAGWVSIRSANDARLWPVVNPGFPDWRQIPEWRLKGVTEFYIAIIPDVPLPTGGSSGAGWNYNMQVALYKYSNRFLNIEKYRVNKG